MTYEKLHLFKLRYKGNYHKSLYYFTCLVLSLFLAFLEIAENCLSGKWMYDLKAINYVNNVRDGTSNSIFKVITATGNTIPVIIITLSITVYFIFMKKKTEALFFCLDILGVWIFNEILKATFKRPRPAGLWLVNAVGYSFPSGHAMIFMALSLLSIYYILISIKNKKVSIMISLLIFIYSVFVGLSRVYVGVHYLSDVLAGWMAGMLWIILTVSLKRYTGFEYKLKDEQEKEIIIIKQKTK